MDSHDDDFGWMDETMLESPATLDEPLLLKGGQRRRKNLAALKKEKIEDFLTELPSPGETWHMVTNGRFDYWLFVPRIVQIAGRPADEFYGSTWILSHPNAVEMLEMFDSGKLKKITFFSGTYFKKRENSVYFMISSGLLDRGQRMLCFENHSKVSMLKIGNDHYVLEGSANYTANPRLEQNTLTNDRDVYEFHRRWMEELLNAG